MAAYKLEAKHLIIFFALVGLEAQAATVIPEDHCSFFVAGTIDRLTPPELKKALLFARTFRCKDASLTVRLDSPGGDVKAAMAMGEVLRAADAHTIVPASSSCASACVLAMVGGTWRMVAGRIGLHRPYPVSPVSSVEDARKRRRTLEQELTRYLESMGIPSNLLGEMNATPPGELRWLHAGQPSDERILKALGVQGEDAASADLRDSREAERLGLSMAELYRRRQLVEATCPAVVTLEDIPKRLQCRQDVLAGRR